MDALLQNIDKCDNLNNKIPIAINKLKKQQTY